MELTISPHCPNCRKPLIIKARDAKPGKVITCPHCQQSIKIKGDDLSKLQKSIDSLQKTIRDFNRKQGSLK